MSALGDTPSDGPPVPATGWAALLAGLPDMGPARLTALLREWPPEEAWARATSGDPGRLVGADGQPLVVGPDRQVHRRLIGAWHSVAHGADPAVAVAAHAALGIQILLLEDPRYPRRLAADIEPPAVLFALGRLDALDRPLVAIVGTRRCTGTGAGVARELGRDLADAGVAVLSGLALGIDGAAHRGALAASAAEAAAPVGVVGSGLDVVYPARHRDLWAAVAERGLLLGEAPAGTRPHAWRFPARNRILAALADVVVVVESHATGGSLLTVEAALRRDRPVLAVPGSVRSPSAAGTNQLLSEGCHPARDATDVLVALGLSGAPAAPTRVDRRPAPGPEGDAVLDAFDWEPATLEHLAVRTGLALPVLAVTVERLVATGWVTRDGGWYERVAAP